MIDGLKPHLAMKDSCVPWLGEVPEHWDIKRGKSVFRCIDVRSSSGDEELLTVSSDRGVVPRSSAAVTMFKAESYVGYKLCWPGDLVINSLWAWGRGLGVSRHHGIVSSAYGVYRLRPLYSAYSAYIHELVRSTPFNWELQVRSKGIWISRLLLTDEAFLGAPFPLPPPDEQAAIVRFLNHANRNIRRYLRAKQKLIKMLEEQKQAIIHSAVTRGLDPDVRLKPSGVEWLGHVPEHWEVKRLRHLADLRVSNVDKHTKEDEQPVRLCNYVDVYRNDYISPSMNLMRATATKEEIERFRLAAGDVLITKDSEAWSDIAVPALVGESADDLISGYHLALLRPHQGRIAGEFLFRALQSAGVKYQFHVEANGVTRYGLSHAAIRSVWIPAPPLGEQAAIVRFLKGATASLVAAVERAYREIELLREYRTRLIAEVVTGKLYVCEVAARLPELEDEGELAEEVGDESAEVEGAYEEGVEGELLEVAEGGE